MANDRQTLESIIMHCGNIADAVAQYGEDEEEFLANIHYSQSCAFSLLQIGEAVKRLSQTLIDSHPQIQWKQIAGFRDVIVHQYGNIDLSMMWAAVVDEVPKLKQDCVQILETLR